jgi:exopolysaccharide biosynthesis polyprenyl glycosylphosphotransferase
MRASTLPPVSKRPLTVGASPRDTGRSHQRVSTGTLVAIVAVVDLLAITGALYAAWWMRFETPLAEFGEPLRPELSLRDYTGHIVCGSVIMLLTLANFRAYDYRTLLSAVDEVRMVCRSSAVWLVVFLGLWLVLKVQPPISRVFCVIAAVTILGTLSCWRLVLCRSILPAIGASFRRKTLLVGWNRDAEIISSSIALSRSPEYEIGGLLLSERDNPGARLPRNIEFLARYDTVEKALDRGAFDAVLVADPNLNFTQLAAIAGKCEKEMVDFEIIPGCFPSLISGLSLKSIYGVPVLGLSRLPLHSVLNGYLKRLIDIAGALVGLAVSVPIIAVVSVLIRRESPGPVFYSQQRLGLNGRHFTMLKLRSMHLESENEFHPSFTSKDDPRCLRIGRIIRSWNIDEVPQFWNVLKGDMSLVGPRPECLDMTYRLKEEIPHYNARHNVKPGMTGWAQVNGLRGDTDLQERVRYDLHYIENWNLLFDLFILCRTFLTKKGAC